MSSLPGLTLEAFLAWQYNITVADRTDANPSLQIAEALSPTSANTRPTLTEEQFQRIVPLFEEYREQVEYLLEEFDEDNQSWRDYAGACFDFIPDELDTKVYDIMKEFAQEAIKQLASHLRSGPDPDAVV